MTVRKTTLSHIVSLLFLPRFLGGCRGTRFHYFRAPFDTNNGVVMSLLTVYFFLFAEAALFLAFLRSRQ